ncbi:hypothetical protein PRZ48_000337 [Zasmidium cellare]|uniref:ABM domain-containing protein n=1 Tax=Zasmidium cellare TaxID=395010 RepID=A0ABR0EZH0_ZASCE|nr:hypothetical protein PRZ48_000337 [Zasmidium cellare]
MASTTSEKITLVGYITPHADRRARSFELWRAIADDIRSEEQGNIAMELFEDVEKEDGGFLILEEFASKEARDAFNVKPSHVAISTSVREEGLIGGVDIGYYKYVLGVGKTIGGDGSGQKEKVVMGGWIVVDDGKREMAFDLWKDVAEDVRSTEAGKVAMEVYSIHEDVTGKGGEDKYFLVYEFANEQAREAFGKKPRHVELVNKERELKVFKTVDFKVGKHVLGSGSGIKAT